MCSVFLSLASGVAFEYLHVSEVELYDSSGSKVPSSSLVATASSAYDPYTLASKAIDGIADQSNMMCTSASDASPSLRIAYPCASGSSSLSKVCVCTGGAPRCGLALRCAGLGWAGLGWAGLGWAGLGWAGLGWAGLGWAAGIGLGRRRFHSAK
jgi:hypothetical protein